MTHTYDWSKLDVGWEERAGELRCYENTGSVHPFSVEWLERQADDYAPDRTMVVAGWWDLYPIARAQLAKCRVGGAP